MYQCDNHKKVTADDAQFYIAINKDNEISGMAQNIDTLAIIVMGTGSLLRSYAVVTIYVTSALIQPASLASLSIIINSNYGQTSNSHMQISYLPNSFTMPCTLNYLSRYCKIYCLFYLSFFCLSCLL